MRGCSGYNVQRIEVVDQVRFSVPDLEVTGAKRDVGVQYSLEVGHVGKEGVGLTIIVSGNGEVMRVSCVVLIVGV